MRIIVVSDTHMDFRGLQRLVKQQRAQSDLFLHLGDGAVEIQDLLSLEPGLPLRSVRGNCDLNCGAPESAVIQAEGVRIFMTHGHERQVKHSLGPLKAAARGAHAQIALYGHTHSQYYAYEDGLHVMNPGSLSIPRDGRAGFGVIEVRGRQIVCNLAGLRPEWGL